MRQAPSSLLLVILGAALLWVGGCAEVTQTPSDCTSDQFFDNNAETCRTCPPLELEACPEDCGFELERDARGCWTAVCSCGDICEEGSYYDREALTCLACPEVQPLACREGCPQVSQTQDERGCLQPVCECEE